MSVNSVIELLDTEAEKLGDSKKVFLGGFNRGGTISAATYLQYDQVLGGVVVTGAL